MLLVTGVNDDGYRELLGMHVATAESTASWTCPRFTRKRALIYPYGGELSRATGLQKYSNTGAINLYYCIAVNLYLLLWTYSSR